MTRPFWLTEPCPPWCAAEHLDTDHDHDRHHESDGVEVALSMHRAQYVEVGRDAVGEPLRFDTSIVQGYREREPHISVWRHLHTSERTPGGHVILATDLTLDEAERFANGILDKVKEARS